jgi:hypothetical protein
MPAAKENGEDILRLFQVNNMRVPESEVGMPGNLFVLLLLIPTASSWLRLDGILKFYYGLGTKLVHRKAAVCYELHACPQIAWCLLL